MQLSDSGTLYLQVCRTIEEGILTGAYAEGELIPSTNRFARLYQINPATAARGVNLLAERGLLIKKRGIGMCVAQGARARLTTLKRAEFYERHVRPLKAEAARLEITDQELADMILSEDHAYVYPDSAQSVT